MKISRSALDSTNQYLPAIFRYPDKMVVDIVMCVSCFLHQGIYGPLTRYRFRFSFKCSRYSIHPAPERERVFCLLFYKSYGEWGEISIIMSSLRLFWIGFCTIALRSTQRKIAIGSKNRKQQGLRPPQSLSE
jgi:hypothetical protein